MISSFYAKHRIVQVQHPSFSPDLGLCDFFFFLKLKVYLKSKIWGCQGDEEKYNIAAWYWTKKGVLEMLQPMKILLEYIVKSKGTIFKKLTFYSLFTTILVNIASVSILFENSLWIDYLWNAKKGSILKKINIPSLFIPVLGNTTFWAHLAKNNGWEILELSIHHSDLQFLKFNSLAHSTYYCLPFTNYLVFQLIRHVIY